METNKALQTVLTVNALFSGLSGLVISIFHQAIAHFMGISKPLILLGTGIGLILFSLSIVLVIRKGMINKQVKSIIYQDWAWVAGSVVLLILHPFDISFEGNILIGVIALIVAAFAIGQQINLKKE